MKILGAIFILLASTFTGFEVAKQLSERPRQLRQLKTALRSLESEIMYSNRPLHEISHMLSKQFPNPLSLFFKEFEQRLTQGMTTAKEAWEYALQTHKKALAFKEGELEVLKQFGETLGQHDRYSQQKHILLAINHLDREEQDALEQQNRYEKMIKSLGFLSGLLLVILLM
ncbi:stage III sporulation protein SpoAB [Bacillus sp. VT 712]|uniref:Stage III sporulation protein SpoAB n=1 Tax=Priestia veravalensis TaxID=1414648 RepID=A0A0V8JNA7_9BACI|nr:MULTISPECIES: stage III sporulation protein SpoIIIAB [Bacillaceae]KSU88456.1 stage III sporulation protein SpoAB [Priestia veravalensis]KZB93146.1 stage III sporulation protein SpoAB [Bacillus sp. VT 712]SCC12769.1 stage III sporulation protein AB [Priestia flexa]